MLINLVINRIQMNFTKSIVLMLLLSSCTSTNHLPVASTSSKFNVEVFFKDTQSPTRDYVIIAYVESTGSIFTTQSQLITALKKRANKLGGNAIIQVEMFYIPWVLSSLPSAKCVVVKYN